jgi:hypothetical protein
MLQICIAFVVDCDWFYLRHVPDDKFVVLGLISTKRPQTEAPEDLIRRVKEASRVVPLERLALSPQCGFASSIVGNDLSIEDERRKLETLCETAIACFSGSPRERDCSVPGGSVYAECGARPKV